MSALLCAAILGSLEAAVRLIGPQKFSKDLIHIHQIPEISQSNPSILFVGSSVVRTDLDMSILRAQRIMLDDATIGTWYFALKKYFLGSESHLRVVVLGFTSNHLALGRVNVPEVAQYFSSPGDASFLFRNSLPSFGSKVDYALNRFSLFYSLRERIGSRILWSFIPGYREAAHALHRSNMTETWQEEGDFFYLDRLSGMTQARGVRVVALWLPTLRPQQDRPLLRKKLDSLGIALLDLSRLHVGDDGCFDDPMHMNPACASVLTGEIRDALAAIGVDLQ